MKFHDIAGRFQRYPCIGIAMIRYFSTDFW